MRGGCQTAKRTRDSHHKPLPTNDLETRNHSHDLPIQLHTSYHFDDIDTNLRPRGETLLTTLALPAR
ncbi:hypothetical protein RESH_03055 [Rhodopirellula europaea SH398]|uniref:Uncharacterized protein n=1 Tax=Rhodopirellula europaea SH398 TaxID=1263868 RepID=M5SJ70_9BACT|nr:hypothetical protein RESH_03055 [Rhodopirellula europaea SH398]